MPNLVDTTSAVRTTATTAALNINKPAGSSAGMWMVALVFDDRSSSGAWVPPAGGGWEQIFNSWTDNSDVTVAAFIRKIDGTEGAGPYAFTPGGSTACGGWIQLWEGLDPLYPVVNFAYADEAAVASMTAPFAGCAVVGFSAFDGSDAHPVTLGGSGWSAAGTLQAGIGDAAGGAGAYAFKEDLGVAGTGSQGMSATGAIADGYQSIVLMLAPDWTTGGATETPIEFAGSVAAFGSYTAPTPTVLTPDFSALPFETDDMLVAVCWVTDDVPTWTPPAGAGWTTRGNLSTTGGDDRRLTVFTKPVIEGEDTTPDFTISGGTGGPYAVSVAVELWKGLDPVTPFEFIDAVTSIGNPSWWYLGASDVLTPGAVIWQGFGAWTSAANVYTDPLHFTRRSDFSAEPDYTDRLIISASRMVPNPINDFRQRRWAQTGGTLQDRMAFQMVMRPGLFAPEGITATELSCSEILVEWGSVVGADGYLVERSDDGVSGWVEVADTTAFDFTDTGLNNDSEYFYRVTAYNSSGDGGWSDVVSATTEALFPPTVIATATSCFEIHVEWDIADCATGYRLEASSNGGVDWVALLSDTTDLEFDHTGLDPGSEWHYRVTTLKDAEASTPSPVDIETTNPLGSPTGLTLGIVNCSTISAEWDAVPCADNYILEGSLTGDIGTWVEVFNGPETEFIIGGRDCNTEYFIRVTAHTVVGPTTSSPSTVQSITTPVPLAPPGLGADAPDCFGVNVEWLTAACANHYILERSLDGSTGWTEIADVTGSTFRDIDIDCETTYYYRVTSYCGDAAGGISMVASVLTPAPIPAFNVVANCAEGGYVIEVNLPAEYDNPVTVQRRDVTTGNAAPVRGLQHLPPGTYSRIVDYEAPLDHAVIYDLYDDVTSVSLATVVPVPLRTVCGEDTMYLRWLFDPTNMTGAFCLGTIEEQEYQPRAGIFPVISRADPVVVIDEQETARGTLRFIAQTTDEVKSLRKVLTKSAQPTLLNLPSAYMLGLDGVLYFQPLSVREQWLNQDGRIPQHAFDVDYIEISSPPLAGVLEKSGVRYGLREGGIAGGVTYSEGGWINWDIDPPDGVPHGSPDDRWPSYGDLDSSGKNYGEALFDTP